MRTVGRSGCWGWAVCAARRRLRARAEWERMFKAASVMVVSGASLSA
jgi:hypothetical protein